MPDQKPQIEKFKDAARKLDCDDDPQRLKDRIRRLVRGGAKKDTDFAGDGEV